MKTENSQKQAWQMTFEEFRKEGLTLSSEKIKYKDHHRFNYFLTSSLVNGQAWGAKMVGNNVIRYAVYEHLHDNIFSFSSGLNTWISHKRYETYDEMARAIYGQIIFLALSKLYYEIKELFETFSRNPDYLEHSSSYKLGIYEYYKGIAKSIPVAVVNEFPSLNVDNNDKLIYPSLKIDYYDKLMELIDKIDNEIPLLYVDINAPKAWELTKSAFLKSLLRYDNEIIAQEGGERDKVTFIVEPILNGNYRGTLLASNGYKSLKYPNLDKKAMQIIIQKGVENHGLTYDPSYEFVFNKNIDFELKHKKVVQKALKEGKQVPAEVLADYPELAQKTERAKFEMPNTKKATTIRQVIAKLKIELGLK